MPKAEYSVEDTRDVVGLIGTGSNDVIIDDIFIPAHRMLTSKKHCPAVLRVLPSTATNCGAFPSLPRFH